MLYGVLRAMQAAAAGAYRRDGHVSIRILSRPGVA
jgi:hypothetical protein